MEKDEIIRLKDIPVPIRLVQRLLGLSETYPCRYTGMICCAYGAFRFRQIDTP